MADIMKDSGYLSDDEWELAILKEDTSVDKKLARVLSIPIFDIDKEKDFALYETMFYRMVSALYSYTLAVYKDKALECSEEINSVANYSIKNYDKSKGDFINYYKYNVARKIRSKLENMSNEDNNHGMTNGVSAEDRKAIKTYVRYIEGINKDPYDDEIIRKYAEGTGIDYEKFAKKLALYRGLKFVDNTYSNDDGDENDVFSFVKDDKTLCWNDVNDRKIFITCCEKLYRSCQGNDNSKNMISAWLTLLLYDNNIDAERLYGKLSFISKEIVGKYIKIRQDLKAGKKLSNADINIKMTYVYEEIGHVKKSSGSRTIKNAKDKLNELLSRY